MNKRDYIKRISKFYKLTKDEASDLSYLWDARDMWGDNFVQTLENGCSEFGFDLTGKRHLISLIPSKDRMESLGIEEEWKNLLKVTKVKLLILPFL